MPWEMSDKEKLITSLIAAAPIPGSSLVSGIYSGSMDNSVDTGVNTALEAMLGGLGGGVVGSLLTHPFSPKTRFARLFLPAVGLMAGAGAGAYDSVRNK
jgi:hypothetical protein